MTIEPYFSSYPSSSNLTSRQLETYLYLKEKLDKSFFVDVDGNGSYIMLYLNDLIHQIIDSNEPKQYYVHQIEHVKKHYTFDFIQDYCTLWLGDIYFFFLEYEQALTAWMNGLRPEKIWTLLSSKVISLKLQNDIQLTAVESLSYKKKITSFGKSNMLLLIKYVDEILKQDYRDGSISSKYFLDQRALAEGPANLFSGSIYGWDINQFYQQRKKTRNEIKVENLEVLSKYLEDVSRRAENAIREDMELPRIGEGWISETELYYKLKSHFKEYSVIQHYNDKWLGKQHLDVYIKELNIGVEYHGLQHFQPVDFFGGESSFIENQKRDKKKINKCKLNSTQLIVLREGYDFDELVTKIRNLTSSST